MHVEGCTPPFTFYSVEKWQALEQWLLKIHTHLGRITNYTTRKSRISAPAHPLCSALLVRHGTKTDRKTAMRNACIHDEFRKKKPCWIQSSEKKTLLTSWSSNFVMVRVKVVFVGFFCIYRSWEKNLWTFHVHISWLHRNNWVVPNSILWTLEITVFESVPQMSTNMMTAYAL